MKWRSINPRWGILTLTLAIFIIMTPIIFAEPINDGSFENIPSDWIEFNFTPCNPTGIGDWSTVNGAPPNIDGQQSLWVGGLCDFPTTSIPRINGARQEIPLAEDAKLLSFWFNPIKFMPDPQNLDRAVVTIDTIEIWSMVINGVDEPTGWNNAIVDISQFADDTVSLALAIEQNNDISIANVFFDAIEVFHPQITVSQLISPTAVFEGESFSVEITIENNGDTLLENVAVSNSSFVNCDQPVNSLPSLAPGETTSYGCNVTNAETGMANTATVQATTTEIDYPVEANETINVPVVNPVLDLEITPIEATITEGEQLAFNFVLTNNGTTTLNDVAINSEPETGCILSLDTLAVDETAVLNCTFIPNASGTILFTATAVESMTNSEVTTETAVSIELLPFDPPTIPTYQLYLPATLNTYLSQNELGEPNDACSQAYPIETNQVRQFLAENIHDWYHFSLDDSSDVTINLTEFKPVAGQITIWKGSCGNLALLGQNGDFSETKTIALTNQTAGEYYIWLINDGGENYIDKYTLNVITP